jgi:hypothetical protein
VRSALALPLCVPAACSWELVLSCIDFHSFSCSLSF